LSVESTTGTGRNPQLDGLRGYAAVAVAIYHAILVLDVTQAQRILTPTIFSISSGYDRATKIVLAAFDGKAAVSVFFVLSGAVLLESLRRNPASSARIAVDFTARRLLRIYPVFFVCLVACFLGMAAVGDPQSAGRFWGNAMLRDFTIVGASWTLQVEFLAVPIILLAYAAFRARGPAGIAAVCLAVALGLQSSWLRPHLDNLRSSLLCLSLGLLIPTAWGSWVARRFPPGACIWVLGFMLASRHLIPEQSGGIEFQKAAAGLLVALIYHGRAGAIGSFLSRGVSVFLGRISYSFYLFNVLFLQMLTPELFRHASPGRHPLEFGLGLAAVVIVLTIPVAVLSERFLERPSIELGRRFSAWFRRPSDRSDGAAVADAR
jgi:peptidoglycan/LPS O-acetylase OafA/YrhL